MFERQGGMLERWQCKSLEDTNGPLGARKLALGQFVTYRSGAPIELNVEPNLIFQFIHAKLVCEADSNCVSYVQITRAEPVHMKEMRSVLQVARLRLQKKSNWGKRFVLFSDNVGVVFAF